MKSPSAIIFISILVFTAILGHSFYSLYEYKNHRSVPDSVREAEFYEFIQTEFDQFISEFKAESSIAIDDSVLLGRLQSGEISEFENKFRKRPFSNQFVVFDRSDQPVGWSGLTIDLVKSYQQNKSAFRNPVLETPEALYLVQRLESNFIDPDYVLIWYRIIGYKTPYFPSDLMPPSFAAALAEKAGWESVPVCSSLQAKEKDSVYGHPLNYGIHIELSANQIEAGYPKLYLNDKVQYTIMALTAELCLFLALFGWAFSKTTDRNVMVLILSVFVLILGFVHFDLGFFSIFLPEDSTDFNTAYLSSQTYGLIPDLNSWVNLSGLVLVLGLIMIGLEFPYRGGRPRRWQLYTWGALASVLFGITLLFVQRIIGSSVLDGWVTGFPMDLSFKQPGTWILLSTGCFLTGITAMVWVTFKIYHLQWSFRLSLGNLIALLGIMVVPALLFQLFLGSDQLIYLLIVSLTMFWMFLSVWTTIYWRIRWKHSLQSWFNYMSLIVTGFIPVFFLIQEINNERLEILQKNYAVELADPNEGWIDYLIRETTLQLKNRFRNDTLIFAGNQDVSSIAYDAWLQSLFSRELIPVRILISDHRLTPLSVWNFRMPDFTDPDSLALVSLRESALQNPDGNLLKTKTEENKHLVSQLFPVFLADTIAGFCQIDVIQPDDRKPLETIGLLSSGYSDDSYLNFETATFISGKLTDASNRNVFPVKISDELIRVLNLGRAIEFTRSTGNQSFSVFLYSDPRQKEKAIAVARQLPDMFWIWNQFSPLLILVIVFLFVLYFILFLVGWIKYRNIKFTFRERVFIGIVSASLLVFWGLIWFVEQTFNSQSIKTSVLFLDNSFQNINSQVLAGLREGSFRSVSAGQDFLIYRDKKISFSTRPEWIRLNIMPDYLSAELVDRFSRTDSPVNFYRESSIRKNEFIVGFYPLSERGFGDVVVAIPNLLSRKGIENELETARSLLVSGYVLFLIFLFSFFSIWINWLLRPVRVMERAFARLARQRDPVYVKVKGIPEIESFARSFNAMVDDLNHYKDAMVKAERQLAWQEMAKQVAHEIKNPLSPLRLNTQLLLHLYKTDRDQFDRVFGDITGKILKEIESMDRIAKTFAQYSRMPDIRPEPLDIEFLCREAILLFQSETVNATIQVTGDNKLVLGDRESFNRVLNNLFKNSIQARRLKTVDILISISFSDQWLELSFRDNGKGISETIIPMVFEPNFSTKTGGMGLGLAITHKIIQEMGGSIRLESKADAFTDVLIRLPLIS